MDPDHHAILEAPIRNKPWIRNYNEVTGRDERHALHVEINKEREQREFMGVAAAVYNTPAPVKQTPYIPTFSSLSAMPRFAVPPRGPLEPSYSSVRADGELPIVMSMAERPEHSLELHLNTGLKQEKLLLDHSLHINGVRSKDSFLLIDQSEHPHRAGRVPHFMAA